MAPPARLELTTLRLGGARSIQVSYGGLFAHIFYLRIIQLSRLNIQSSFLQQFPQQRFVSLVVQHTIPFDIGTLSTHAHTGAEF